MEEKGKKLPQIIATLAGKLLNDIFFFKSLIFMTVGVFS